MSDDRTFPQHTLGPWVSYPHPNPDCAAIAIGQQNGSFASAHTTCYLNADANSRLIAAAPELLALAKKLASECADCHGLGYVFLDDGITGFGPDDREPTREACVECEDIRVVIAKAEGSQP